MTEISKPQAEPKAISVPVAGKRFFGLGRNGSYAAAARGEIPTIRIGRKLLVPVVACERMLADCVPRVSNVA